MSAAGVDGGVSSSRTAERGSVGLAGGLLSGVSDSLSGRDGEGEGGRGDFEMSFEGIASPLVWEILRGSSEGGDDMVVED